MSGYDRIGFFVQSFFIPRKQFRTVVWVFALGVGLPRKIGTAQQVAVHGTVNKLLFDPGMASAVAIVAPHIDHQQTGVADEQTRIGLRLLIFPLYLPLGNRQ